MLPFHECAVPDFAFDPTFADNKDNKIEEYVSDDQPLRSAIINILNESHAQLPFGDIIWTPKKSERKSSIQTNRKSINSKGVLKNYSRKRTSKKRPKFRKKERHKNIEHQLGSITFEEKKEWRRCDCDIWIHDDCAGLSPSDEEF